MERISKTRNIKYQGAFPDEERPDLISRKEELCTNDIVGYVITAA